MNSKVNTASFRSKGFPLLLILFLVISNLLLAQIPNTVINQYHLDNTSTFYQIQDAMNNYFASLNVKNGYVLDRGEQTKMPGWKLYKRWEYYWEQRINHITGEFPQTNSVIEYDKYKFNLGKLNKQTSYLESWVNLGSNYSTGGYAGIGRINCVAFHPTDLNTFWVGSPSGGLWKTTNGGSSWAILNDNQPVLGVSDIIIPSDYATSNTIYIATGDRDAGSMWSLGGGQAADNVSVGVLKSTDGGASWNTTGLSYVNNLGKLVYSLLIHPSNNSILFASTTDGIYKTTDGGTSWVQKSVWPSWRLAFKPGDPTTMYSSRKINGGPYFAKSTDSGETWTSIQITTTGYRTELCVTPADPNIIYLLAANSGGGLLGVYKSTNSGASFSRVDAGSKSMLYYYSDGSGSNIGQGSYDLTIASSPTDANTVFIGGINTWKSADGGVNWVVNNMWTSYSGYNFSGAPEVHADKHALSFQNGTTLFEGNDGGIYKTTNGGSSWIDLTNGMVTSQIYRIGVAQLDANTVLTGLQDNGSKKYSGGSSTWVDVYGGDGMECIVDYSNSNYMYVTYVQGEIHRNTDGFSTYATTTISANIPGGQPVGAWVTPYIIDPTNSTILYTGYDKIWKTSDRGNTWTSASQVLSSSQKIRSLAIAPSNTSIIYAADLSHLWKTTDGGATNWSAITLPSTATSVTYITVKNNDPNTLWITYGGYNDGSKIYQSTDGGGSWTNISTGLPNLPVMSVVYYKAATDRNVLFVGTDVGIYVKDGANNWASYSTGLPNVVVTELEIYYGGGTNKLRAGTFGRGLWETNIEAALPVELSSFTALFNNHSVNLKWTTKTEVNNFGFQIERTNLTTRDLSFNKIGFIQGHGFSNSQNDYSFTDNSVVAGNKYSYRLKQIDNTGSAAYSNIIEVQTGNIPDKFILNQNYPNPFNPSTTIKYQIPRPGLVTLKVYDILGKEIINLVNENKIAGFYEVNFDASKLPSGIYIYQLKVNDFVSNKKMILLK